MGYDHRHTSVSISIHALREEGDGILIGRPSHFFLISIHALREEGDGQILTAMANSSYFYPRPPRGGRPIQTKKQLTTINFYPRPPRGGRLKKATVKQKKEVFLSTPSARRATLAFPGTNPL